MLKKVLSINNDGFAIDIRLTRRTSEDPWTGVITSNLLDNCPGDKLHAAFDAIESIILAHACAGIDVTSKMYVQGVQDAATACENHFS